jgi:ABC transport system ATP-binding/permease protein
MYKLVIQDDEGKTTVVPLIRDELTIGRKEGNTIRLTERNVSRRHARLIRQNGSITIEDLNSYNGIRVNGSRIQGRCQIRETDRVQIGDYLIELKSEAHDKADTLSERTIPIDRIDPHATTPVPDSVEPSDSAVATTRMSKTEAAQVLGQNFVAAVTEPMAPLTDTDPSPGQGGPVPPGPAAGVSPPVAPAAHPVAHARLVALSTGLAGREYDLDKPAMVIGRTEDNDVCINHRSISRHHAKVVRENGRYAIVDLQSSNGVRVNGEEYGKVELRRADVIDLGHVRLRFVEAGEDFLFGRDAQAVDVVPQGSSRTAMWVALALLVVGAAVVLFLIMSGRGQTDEPVEASAPPTKEGGDAPLPAAVTPDGEEAATPAATRADAGAEPSTVSSDDMAKVSKLLDTARRGVEAEKWNDVVSAAKEALAIDASNVDAQGFLDQAQSEIGNEQTYKQFQRAVASRDFAKVAELFKRLDPESVYRVNARADHDRLKTEYVAQKSREGKRHADRSRCREQERVAEEASRLWPEAGRAALSHGCKLPVSSAGTPSGGSAGTPGGESGTQGRPGGDTTPTPPEGSGDGGEGNYEELVEKADTAAVANEYGSALKYCEAAASAKKNDQRALGICALASCRLRNTVKARRYINKISDQTKREGYRNICRQEGVTDI